MSREEAILKVKKSNPSGGTNTSMEVDELIRINAAGDVQAETTPVTASSMLCVRTGVKISSKNCGYFLGTYVGSALSMASCK